MERGDEREKNRDKHDQFTQPIAHRETNPFLFFCNQELLDLSNDINYQQQLRGASTKTWSHGPRRRPPRPPLRPLPAVPRRRAVQVGGPSNPGQEGNSNVATTEERTPLRTSTGVRTQPESI